MTYQLLRFSKQFMSKAPNILFCLCMLAITACSSSTVPSNTSHLTILPPKNGHEDNYICHQPNSYSGKVIGDGQCISLIKTCSMAPNTDQWKAGDKVLSLPQGTIPAGAVIATFKNGRYPNMTGYHAAIYISHDEQGIWVWDQWLGKPVHKRLIRNRVDKATASNKAQKYRLVR